MTIDDLEYLKEEVPELFEDKQLPPQWEEEWLFIPVDSPDQDTPSEIDVVEDSIAPPVSLEKRGETVADPGYPPQFENFPGSPVAGWDAQYLPPPDALAFYLPFHYFYPVWWGVYLTFEGTRTLASYIHTKKGSIITFSDAMRAAQMFLYTHEAYHHLVESFATRLEITHRSPLYKKGFQKIYVETGETSDGCLAPNEETLANAYAFQKARRRFKGRKKEAITEALESYIKGSPPCYRDAMDYVKENDFKMAQSDFAEMNHVASMDIPEKESEIWLTFPHAFSGIARITSRVKYIISRTSPIVKRKELHLRYLRYRDVSKKLKKLAGCSPVRQRGSHEKWKCPGGKPIVVPRHPGDLKKGTLAKIIKQAGLDMPVSKFAELKA